MKKVLRVRIYRLHTKLGKWKVYIDHVFYGDTRIEAKTAAEAHKLEDLLYKAALESMPYKGLKLQARATWVL